MLSINMKTMKIYLSAVLLIMLKLSLKTVAKQECGRIKLFQLYNENPNIILDESPWIGQISYMEKVGDKCIPKFLCNGILVSKRHLLSTAHCFVAGQSAPNLVILGTSNTPVNDTSPDCDKSLCAPPPKQYNIRDVALHPLYTVDHEGENDISVVRLLEEVEFSDFIQPICLPSAEMHTSNYLAQYLIYTGYKRKNVFETDEIHKYKTVAHIVPLHFCKNQYDDIPLSTFVICASYVGHYNFISGSALIGVNVVDFDIKNYYLIGMVIRGTLPIDGGIDLFVRISPYINWIESNMK